MQSPIDDNDAEKKCRKSLLQANYLKQGVQQEQPLLSGGGHGISPQNVMAAAAVATRVSSWLHTYLASRQACGQTDSSRPKPAEMPPNSQCARCYQKCSLSVFVASKFYAHFESPPFRSVQMTF